MIYRCAIYSIKLKMTRQIQFFIFQSLDKVTQGRRMTASGKAPVCGHNLISETKYVQKNTRFSLVEESALLMCVSLVVMETRGLNDC